MKLKIVINSVSLIVIIGFIVAFAGAFHHVLANRYIHYGMVRMIALSFQEVMNTWMIVTMGIASLALLITYVLGKQSMRSEKFRVSVTVAACLLFFSYGVWALHQYWLPSWFHPISLMGNLGILVLTGMLWWLLRVLLKEKKSEVSECFLRILESRYSRTIAISLAALLVLLNVAVFIDSKASTVKKFNVVWVLIDALRADHLGCYGYQKNTSPYIDELGSKSILFRHAFSQESYTQASVPSYFTSTYPLFHQVFYDQPKMDTLDSRFVTFAEILRNANFLTAAFVFNPHLKARYNFGQGFDLYDDNKEGFDKSVPFYETFETARKIFQKVNRYLVRNTRRPLFFYFHYRDVHDPYAPPPPFDKIFLPPSVQAPVDLYKDQTPFTKENLDLFISQYDGEIAYTDHYLKKTMALLESHNITLQNSIIIITADHGEEFLDFHPDDPGGPCHGRTLHREQIHVPLIVSVPGSRFGKKIIEANVELVDIAPTILDILGIAYDRYRQFQGKSLVARMEAGDANSSGADTSIVYSGGNHGRGVVIEGDWKYYSYDQYSKELRERVFMRPSSNYDYVLGEELYNIKADPHETANLIEAEQTIARRLKEKLSSFNQRISSNKGARAVKVDSETKEQLKSLGYVQ